MLDNVDTPLPLPDTISTATATEASHYNTLIAALLACLATYCSIGIYS